MSCAIWVATVPSDAAFFSWFRFMGHAEFILPLVHALWLWGLSTPGCSGPTQWILSSRPMRWLGDVSYALYCLHYPLFNWCAWAVAHAGISSSAVEPDGDYYRFFPSWGVIPIFLVCLAIATAAHILLERPARGAIAKRPQTK